MDSQSIRNYCLSLPYVTEEVKWDEDLCFSIGKKMFALCGLFDPKNPNRVCFKCTPETYSALLQREGITSAPYFGRYQWVSVDVETRLSDEEWLELLKTAYEQVYAKLPARTRAELAAA